MDHEVVVAERIARRSRLTYEAGLDAALAVPGWSAASPTYRAMYARALRNSRLAVAWSRTAAARPGRASPLGSAA
jgi:hypothetical protein